MYVRKSFFSKRAVMPCNRLPREMAESVPKKRRGAALREAVSGHGGDGLHTAHSTQPRAQPNLDIPPQLVPPRRGPPACVNANEGRGRPACRPVRHGAVKESTAQTPHLPPRKEEPVAPAAANTIKWFHFGCFPLQDGCVVEGQQKASGSSGRRLKAVTSPRAL